MYSDVRVSPRLASFNVGRWIRGASGWDNETLRIPIPNEHPLLTDPREFNVAVLPGDGTCIVWFPPHTIPVPHIVISVRGSGGCVIRRYRLCDLDWALRQITSPGAQLSQTPLRMWWHTAHHPPHHLNLIPSPVTLPRPFITAVECIFAARSFGGKSFP